MTDENTYTAPDGTKYLAERFSCCTDCAFLNDLLNCGAAACTYEGRTDNRNIIWIKESP